MQRPTTARSLSLSACALGLVAALAATTGSAQSGGPYAITRSTIDNGGGLSASGNVAITGTIGQPDATATLRNGNLRLRGGFWAATGEPLPNDPLFSNSFE